MVDEGWMPVGLSFTEKGTLIDYVAERLDIRAKWKLFGALWHTDPETVLVSFFLRARSPRSTLSLSPAACLHACAVHLFLDAPFVEEALLLCLDEACDEHVKLVQHGDGDVGRRLVRARVHHVLVVLGLHVSACV